MAQEGSETVVGQKSYINAHLPSVGWKEVVSRGASVNYAQAALEDHKAQEQVRAELNPKWKEQLAMHLEVLKEPKASKKSWKKK